MALAAAGAKLLQGARSAQSAGRGAAMARSEAAKAAGEAQTNPLAKLTGMLLSESWKYLIASFGLTFIYITIHFIGRYVAHFKWFSDFGTGLQFGKLPAKADGTPSVRKEAEYAEIILFLMILLMIFLALLTVTIIIFIAVMPYTNPTEVIALIGKSYGCLIDGILGTNISECS